jgi:hypothetical protein
MSPPPRVQVAKKGHHLCGVAARTQNDHDVRGAGLGRLGSKVGAGSRGGGEDIQKSKLYSVRDAQVRVYIYLRMPQWLPRGKRRRGDVRLRSLPF